MLVNTKTIITAVLQRAGFRKLGSRWHKFNDGMLVEILWYKSSWDERCYMDVRVAVSDQEVSRSEDGRPYASTRVERLIDSWQELPKLSRKELSKEEAQRFENLLEHELVPVLNQLFDPDYAKQQIESPSPRFPELRNWMYGDPVIQRLEALAQKR